MALAGVPVGVWQDPDGVMDLSKCEELTRISSLEEWVGFLRDARLRPKAVRERQAEWHRGPGLPLHPAEV